MNPFVGKVKHFTRCHCSAFEDLWCAARGQIGVKCEWIKLISIGKRGGDSVRGDSKEEEEEEEEEKGGGGVHVIVVWDLIQVISVFRLHFLFFSTSEKKNL